MGRRLESLRIIDGDNVDFANIERKKSLMMEFESMLPEFLDMRRFTGGHFCIKLTWGKTVEDALGKDNDGDEWKNQG